MSQVPTFLSFYELLFESFSKVYHNLTAIAFIFVAITFEAIISS
jgi:hypothetical protein